LTLYWQYGMSKAEKQAERQIATALNPNGLIAN
jgi:hypothetical protein